MTLAHLCDNRRNSLRESEVYGYRRCHHQQSCYPNVPHAVATVSVNGVSLTKERLHDWHGVTASELIVLPAASVIVGAVAD